MSFNTANGWVALQGVIDEAFAAFVPVLVDELAPDTRVLDVGCGTGATTIAAAARTGAAVGVDIEPSMITAARERGGENVEFHVADAASHTFAEAPFDAVISRFGVMFFPDPVAAFANLRGALREGGQARFAVWRTPDENPFMTAAAQAVADFVPELQLRGPDEPGQWGLADGDRALRLLEEAGWKDAAAATLEVECTMPADQVEPYVTSLGPVSQVLGELEDDRRQRAIAAAVQALNAFADGETIRYTAACWLLTATA